MNLLGHQDSEDKVVIFHKDVIFSLSNHQLRYSYEVLNETTQSL